MAKRILIIHNPEAGKGKQAQLAQVVRCLDERGAQITQISTQHSDDAEEIVRSECKADFDVIAVAGGDGTLQQVVNGLGEQSPPLALIPVGTANVVAIEMGLMRNGQMIDADLLADIILKGETKTICAGAINERLFVFTAGVGFDANVVAAVSSSLKKKIRKLAFVAAAIRTLFTYKYPLLSLSIDGQKYRGAGVIVMNGQYYGGNYTITPENNLADPGFAVLVLKRAGRMAGLSYLVSLAQGKLHKRQDVIYLKNVRLIDVTGPADLPCQADGEVSGHLPVQIRADVKQVELIV